MKSSAKKIVMTSCDELLSPGSPMEAEGDGKVRELLLTELFPFRGHPFLRRWMTNPCGTWRRA